MKAQVNTDNRKYWLRMNPKEWGAEGKETVQFEVKNSRNFSRISGLIPGPILSISEVLIMILKEFEQRFKVRISDWNDYTSGTASTDMNVDLIVHHTPQIEAEKVEASLRVMEKYWWDKPI